MPNSQYNLKNTIAYFQSLIGQTLTPELISEIVFNNRMMEAHNESFCKVCGNGAFENLLHYNHVCKEHEKYGTMFNLPLALAIDGIPLPAHLDMVKSIATGEPVYLDREVSEYEQEYIKMMREKAAKAVENMSSENAIYRKNADDGLSDERTISESEYQKLPWNERNYWKKA